MSEGVPSTHTIELSRLVHLARKGLKGTAQGHHHERHTEPDVHENDNDLGTRWLGEEVKIGPQDGVDQTFGLEHALPTSTEM